MSTEFIDISLSISSDTTLENIVLDSSLFSDIADNPETLFKLLGGDESKLFKIDEAGNISFIDGITVEMIEQEDGSFRLQVKDQSEHEIIEFNFQLSESAELVSLGNNEITADTSAVVIGIIDTGSFAVTAEDIARLPSSSVCLRIT